MTGTRSRWTAVGALVLGLLLAGPAAAQIKVGITLSTTGPAASLGIPEKNTVTLFRSKSPAMPSNTSSLTTPPTRPSRRSTRAASSTSTASMRSSARRSRRTRSQ